jgi:hypothetical protein
VRILELLAQNDIMDEQEAQALPALTPRCAMRFIIWRCRNSRGTWRWTLYP